jgi:hypothetical protein
VKIGVASEEEKLVADIEAAPIEEVVRRHEKELLRRARERGGKSNEGGGAGAKDAEKHQDPVTAARTKRIVDHYSTRFTFDFTATTIELRTPEDLLALRAIVRLCGGTFLGNFAARYSCAFAVTNFLYLILSVLVLAVTLRTSGGNAAQVSHFAVKLAS